MLVVGDHDFKIPSRHTQGRICHWSQSTDYHQDRASANRHGAPTPLKRYKSASFRVFSSLEVVALSVGRGYPRVYTESVLEPHHHRRARTRETEGSTCGRTRRRAGAACRPPASFGVSDSKTVAQAPVQGPSFRFQNLMKFLFVKEKEEMEKAKEKSKKTNKNDKLSVFLLIAFAAFLQDSCLCCTIL
ncbi:unnamed protein product [Caenorhabditis auriculariae]|uniref:Uncharacterized protein n=1 Tax=Caenorhabditis auriculariae TaxID=2777116 RepID=A0A8S1H8J0_9PELO|nr:unnamed protein product [Caenorhabditis auriculariae]